MKVTANKQWRVSSRDFFKAACEHCTRIDMAVAAGVPEVIAKAEPFKTDVSALLWVMQGNEYERYVFDQFQTQLGEDFVELGKTTLDETLSLLKKGTVAVAQGYLENQTEHYLWSGFPDLLLREDFTIENGQIIQIAAPLADPKYVVWDVKATSEPDDKYWIQVASYSEVLEQHGLASRNDLGLLAKYGKTFNKPRFKALEQLNVAREILINRLSKATPADITVDFIEQWKCEKPSLCEKDCTFPDLCAHIRKEEHSLHLTYRNTHVAKYNAAGILTYDDLAAAPKNTTAVTDETFAKDQNWARLLKEEEIRGTYFELLPQEKWLQLPTPTPDDLFFDIEWFNTVFSKDANIFMFGFVDSQEKFVSLDSLKAEDELRNFQEFVKVAISKMNSNPLARIYHFHTPEVEHLRKLAKRHDQLHDEVEFLVSRMVDLRLNVISMIQPGSNSYSIKKLERYYDADIKLNRKANLVEGGADAMLLYYKATVIDTANATTHMDIIRAYNRDDCLSTKLLRDWLIGCGVKDPAVS
jgi:predicted RecB family nuclease